MPNKLACCFLFWLMFAELVCSYMDTNKAIGDRWYNPPNRIRTYYIAALDAEWDYAPTGMNLVDNEMREFNNTLVGGEERVGRRYTKVVIRRYTDATFTRQMPHPHWLGFLGPIIRAEMGDVLMIHFRNFATGRHYSLHPHGYRYFKDSEGAFYEDNTSGADKLDDAVPPGGAHTYQWNMTRNFAPSRDDENCIAGAYHSHFSPTKDVNTGTAGLLLLCRRGVLSNTHERIDGFRDLVLYPELTDENKSWKMRDNTRRCGNPARCQQLLDSNNPGFRSSNFMYTFNGYMFGNLNYDVTEGEQIAMHIMSLNLGAHGISINGQTFTYLKRRSGTINIYPATFLSTQLVPVNPGRWLVQCRVTAHYKGGMRAFLTVHRRNVPLPPLGLHGRIRKFYLAAEEIEWNYGPSGQNVVEGGSLTAPGSKSQRYFERGPNRIGGTYKKAKYFEYTNEEFHTKKTSPSSCKHLGILGPVLRAEVGETVEVVFRNSAKRPYSFMVHGVNIAKEEEGAYYKNEFGRMQGKIAQPGQTVVYRFTVPESVSPTRDDAQCLTYTYQSAVDAVKDIYSGLIGPLLVCKRGILDRNGNQVTRTEGTPQQYVYNCGFGHDESGIAMVSYVLQAAQTGHDIICVLIDGTDVFVSLVYWTYKHENNVMYRWSKRIDVLNINATNYGLDLRCLELPGMHVRYVDREFHLLYNVFDENDSWYIDENIQQYTTMPSSVDKTNSGFRSSNRMAAINGLVFGNLDGLDMCLGEDVIWHINGYNGVHGTHFHGNTLQIFQIQKDSQVAIPGSSYTGIMKPDNPGTWQVICRTNAHFTGGMRALYNVHRCKNSPRPYTKHRIGGNPGQTRRYYIAAMETYWDYVPRKTSAAGEDITHPNATGYIYVRDDANFIGSIYRKVIYREFTDSTFTRLKPRTASEEHLGILGPYIKAEIYDDIIVTFRNFARRPYSIHPHGVLYDKMNEGASYQDNARSSNGDAVQPGETYNYHWYVPPRSGPSVNDPNCIPWIYYSSVESVNDTNSGLVGPIVICRRGYLDENNKRTDVDHEFVLFFTIFNENLSWYLQHNIQRFAPNRTNLNDRDFVQSNQMHAINGFVFGNLKGLDMYERQSIAWYTMGLGNGFDVHTIHLHGQTFLHRSNAVHREDVIEVFQGTYEAVEMYTDNPGTWLLHCHVSVHSDAGMEATFKILPMN